jgi:hypothetical protein
MYGYGDENGHGFPGGAGGTSSFQKMKQGLDGTRVSGGYLGDWRVPGNETRDAFKKRGCGPETPP